MREARLLDAQGEVLAAHVEVAGTLTERMVGLLGRSGLPAGHLVFLAPCSAIHTMGMRFAIDVVFVDRSFRVVRAVRNVRPTRMCVGGLSAWGVLEAETGWLPLERVATGTPLTLAGWSSAESDAQCSGPAG